MSEKTKTKSEDRKVRITYKDDALEIIEKINEVLVREGLHFAYTHGEDGVVEFTLKRN